MENKDKKSGRGESLFFIAVVPPIDVRENVTKLKNELSVRFNSNHALRSPPHITLHMPFRLTEKKYELMVSLIGQTLSGQEPFPVNLRDFDFFEPRVVFVNVLKNDGLDRLFSIISNTMRKVFVFNASYKRSNFHPHMTIGFRDLKKSDFYAAKAFYEKEKFQASFMCSSCWLLKHNGKNWDLYHEWLF